LIFTGLFNTSFSCTPLYLHFTIAEDASFELRCNPFTQETSLFDAWHVVT